MPRGRFLVSSIFMKFVQFLKETRLELTNVNWPSRRRAIIYTAIIILFSVGLGYLMGGFDTLFREILKLIVVK